MAIRSTCAISTTILILLVSNLCIAQPQQQQQPPRSEQLQLLLEQQMNTAASVITGVDLQCQATQMRLLLNITGQFSGRIYPLGLANKPTCVSEVRDATASPIAFMVPLDSAACGTKLQTAVDKHGTSEATNTIVVQPHDKLVTEMARAYEIRCIYDYAGRTLGSNVSVSMMSTQTQRFTAQAPAPAASLELFRIIRENSTIQPAEFVNVGDLLEMRIQLGGSALDYYGLVISNCRVFDGNMNMDQQQLIDINGCPLFPQIFPAFVYESNRTTAATIFKAHKFPLTATVGYECDVDFCLRANAECEAIEATRSCSPAGGSLTVGGVPPTQRTARRTIGMNTFNNSATPTPTSGFGGLGVAGNATIRNNSAVDVAFVGVPLAQDATTTSPTTSTHNVSAGRASSTTPPPINLNIVGTPLAFVDDGAGKTVDNAAASNFTRSTPRPPIVISTSDNAAPTDATAAKLQNNITTRLQALGSTREAQRKALATLGLNASDIELLLDSVNPSAASTTTTTTGAPAVAVSQYVPTHSSTSLISSLSTGDGEVGRTALELTAAQTPNPRSLPFIIREATPTNSPHAQTLKTNNSTAPHAFVVRSVGDDVVQATIAAATLATSRFFNEPQQQRLVQPTASSLRTYRLPVDDTTKMHTNHAVLRFAEPVATSTNAIQNATLPTSPTASTSPFSYLSKVPVFSLGYTSVFANMANNVAVLINRALAPRETLITIRVPGNGTHDRVNDILHAAEAAANGTAVTPATAESVLAVEIILPSTTTTTEGGFEVIGAATTTTAQLPATTTTLLPRSRVRRAISLSTLDSSGTLPHVKDAEPVFSNNNNAPAQQIERRVRIKNFLTVLGEEPQRQRPALGGITSGLDIIQQLPAERPRKQRLSTNTLALETENTNSDALQAKTDAQTSTETETLSDQPKLHHELNFVVSPSPTTVRSKLRPKTTLEENAENPTSTSSFQNGTSSSDTSRTCVATSLLISAVAIGAVFVLIALSSVACMACYMTRRSIQRSAHSGSFDTSSGTSSPSNRNYNQRMLYGVDSGCDNGSFTSSSTKP